MGICETTIEQVKHCLEQYPSPGLSQISHETIYRMIYANHYGLGESRRYLRQGPKKRRPRTSIYQKRVGIPGRVGIKHCPEIADLKIEIGHWESDTVIGGNHTFSLKEQTLRL